MVRSELVAAARAALLEVGALPLRRLGREYGVAPDFYIHGRQKFLRAETLRERLIEAAERRSDAEIARLGDLAVKYGATRRDGTERAAESADTASAAAGMEADAGAEATEAEEMHAAPPRAGVSDGAALLGALQAYVQEAVQAVRVEIPDSDTVREMIAEAVNAQTRVVSVRVNDAAPIRIAGLAHAQFPKLLEIVTGLLGQGLHANVWIAGPAGGGKTTAAKMLAAALSEALGETFIYRENGAIDSEYKLSGFVDAMGRIVSTQFREAYPVASVYCFDELDRSLPSAVLAFNGALANGQTDFPGCTEPTQRHARCVILACANTFGHGANGQYVGAMKQDGAFLDRFVRLAWNYDTVLERACAQDDRWVDTVQDYRRRAADKGLRVIISPRASIYGAALLRAGMSREAVLDAVLWDGIPADTRAALEG